MRNFILKWLMKLSGALSAKEVKVNSDLIEEWLKGLASESNGYKHYYTMRKRHIQEGFTSGITQEQYWFNCGRLTELQYINALSVKLLKTKKKKYAVQEPESSESRFRGLLGKDDERES